MGDYGPIAQWLEQRTHNSLVAGSSPAGPTIILEGMVTASDFQRKVSCVYYSENGKFKYSGECLVTASEYRSCVYPRDYGRRLRSENRLPGIASGYWPCYFSVCVDEQYWELVLPEKQF